MRELAEQLKTDGVRVSFDERVLKPGDNIPARTEERLGYLHVLETDLSGVPFHPSNVSAYLLEVAETHVHIRP